ncbi:MAG: DUF357 domain-containing protein [Thermoplasmataceae archaeon]
MEDLREKVEKYLKLNLEALSKIKVAAPKDSFFYTMATDFMEMIRSYSSDALHFKEKGDLINAFAALNYAHGWIDAGARIGIFDVDLDHRLFTLYR